MNGIYSRWGQELGSEQEWEVLKNRLQILLNSSTTDTSQAEVELIAFDLGKPTGEISPYTSGWHVDSQSLLDDASTPFELARIAEALVKRLDNIGDRAETIATVINNAKCGITMKQTKEGWLTYPSGEEILDEALVNKPLSFLEDQPLKEYERALEHYSARKWEECAEKVRRALEEYLRFKLGTKQGLDKAILELANKLKISANVPQHLVSTIIGILKILDKNFNESSKHQSATYDEKECEFLIYQAGLLMVILDKINIS